MGGEERRWTKIHQPVFGLEACTGYVEAYTPREIHFFNPIFLAYVYVVLWFVTRLNTAPMYCKCQSSFVQKLIIRFEIIAGEQSLSHFCLLKLLPITPS